MKTNFTEIVVVILECWLELSESSLDKTGRMTIGELLLQQGNKSLAEAMEADPEGVAALMLVSKNIRDYMNKFSYSLTDLVENPEGCTVKVSQAAEVMDMLKSTTIRNRIGEFKDSLSRAFKHYGLNQERSESLMVDEILLGELRMSALKSMDKLRLDQFTRGHSDSRPTYNGVVHRFLSVSALVDAALHMKQNISLCVVVSGERNRNMFYVFAIRNGGNVYLLSDLNSPVNPVLAKLSQTATRDHYSRIDCHHFPYDLTRNKVAEGFNGKVNNQPGLPVTFGSEGEAWPITSLVDLPDESLVWTIMMFELISKRFWQTNIPQVDLSVTGAMVKHRGLLKHMAEDQALVTKNDLQWRSEPLKSSDLTSVVGDEDTHTLSHEDDRAINAWMADRYGAEASAIIDKLNEREKSDAESMDLLGSDSASTDYQKDRREPGLIPNNWMATRKQIQSDRSYLARKAWAHELERLATEELDRERKAVKQWYKEAVEANLPALMDKIGTGNEYYHPFTGASWSYVNRPFSAFGGNYKKDKDGKDGKDIGHRLMVVDHVKARHSLGGRDLHNPTVLTKGDKKSGKPACVVTGSVSTYRVFFDPKVVEDIEFLTGVDRDNMPVFLKHWMKDKPYIGNSTFARTDPLVAFVKNPWYKVNFAVIVYLSKRALNQLREVSQVKPPEKPE
jgi:hypothetical protein